MQLYSLRLSLYQSISGFRKRKELKTYSVKRTDKAIGRRSITNYLEYLVNPFIAVILLILKAKASSDFSIPKDRISIN